MSMLSSQVDALRKAAQSYRGLGKYEAEQMMLDAADTITELRGALSVASVDYRHLSEENAKLRDELAKWERLAAGIDLPEYPITEFKPKDLERENAKLREQSERLFDKALELATENARLRLLVRNLIRATHPADRAELIANAAELGIEVD